MQLRKSISLSLLAFNILHTTRSSSHLEYFVLLITANSTSDRFCFTSFSSPGHIESTTARNNAYQYSIPFNEAQMCPLSSTESTQLKLAKVKWIFTEDNFCTCSNQTYNETDDVSNPTDRYVILELHISFLQDDLDTLRKNYPRKRDHHNGKNVHTCATFFMQALILAEKTNSTLITNGFARNNDLDIEQIPKIRFQLFLYFLHSLDPSEDVPWNQYYVDNGGKLLISLMRFNLPINFGYCATPLLNLMKPWDLHIPLVGFDVTTWVALSATSLGLILFYNSSKYLSLSTILLSLASSLIAPSAKITSKINKSKLFFMWLFVCYVITHCYTGKNASFMIKPSEEEAMHTISEAAAANFSLLFNNMAFFNLLKTWQEAGNGIVQSDFAALRYLLSKWETSKSSIIWNRKDYIEGIAFQDKAIIATGWNYMIGDIHDATNLIQEMGLGKDRHCYVGKRLIPTIEIYRVFIPPNNQDFFRIQQTVDSSGITDFWDKENMEKIYARRVQDRVRVISPTKILYDFERDLSTLKMEGKLVVIFFFWGICLFFCFIVAVFEWTGGGCQQCHLPKHVISINLVAHASIKILIKVSPVN